MAVRILLATIGITMALAAPGTALAEPAGPWMTLLSITFPILADLPGLPVNCTGWYATSLGHGGSMPISVYVTAGHCNVPHIVRMGEGLEQPPVLGHIDRLGVDAAVGVRVDQRATRTFPILAMTLPQPGERALVAGYSAGHLTEAVLTTLPRCFHGFLCFHSDHALRPGMSGASILSLRTGQIIGVLVGTSLDSHGYGDQHTIWATPAVALRALIELAAPGGTEADRAGGMVSSHPTPPTLRWE